MNSKLYTTLLLVFALFAGQSLLHAAPTVKLTTSPVPAADINQGTNSALVYIVKMKVTSAAVIINSVQYTLSGSHDDNDLSYTNVYFNTTPTLTGATSLGYSGAGFAAPHSYTIGIYKPMAAGDSGYFIITVNVAPAGSDGNTIRITGGTTPVVFGYSVAVSLTNSQTNGGLQTIQAADVKLSTSAVAASTDNQGTNTVLIYTIKMKVTTEPAVVNSIQYTLSGTHDANDLTYTNVYFNTTPTLTGATSLGYSGAGFAAPHTYTVGIYKPMAIGDSGYFMITVNIAATATDEKTIRLTASSTPIAFAFTTAPNVTGTQNNGNTHTIQAADIKLSTSTVAASTVNQGTNTVLIYMIKMKTTTEPVVVNSIQYTLSGTHDNNDLTYTNVYFNTTPTLTGATSLGYSGAAFAAPHTYTIGIYKPMAIGDSGYFMMTVNVASTGTDESNIKITASTTPIAFTFTTAPNVTGTQKNGSLHTIQAADIKLSTSAVAAATVNQGTNTVLVYAIKMKATTEPVVVNGIQYTLSGTHDNDDLTYTNVYFNTTPTLAGATSLGYSGAGFAAPHTYTIGIYKPMAIGDSGYFLMTVNVAATATDGKTIRITGGTTPVVFTFATAPNVTGTQTNGAVQTIQAADITLSSTAVAAGNIVRGTNSNIIYVVKMVVATEPIVVNGVQYTLTGTHDNDDLTYTNVYFNTSASLTGATSLGYSGAGFAAPHTYSVGIYKPMAIGDVGYFIITVNVSATATLGKTVILNGNTNPAVFTYATAPNITNNQTNAAGVKTISSSMPFTFNENTGDNAASATAFAPLKIYPNPASAAVNIEASFNTRQEVILQLTNEGGTIVSSKTCTVEKGNTTLQTNVHGLLSGLYQVTIRSKEQAILFAGKIKVVH